jgi:hypothetical protein
LNNHIDWISRKESCGSWFDPFFLAAGGIVVYFNSCTLRAYSDVETRKGSKKQLRALLHILTHVYSIMSLAMGYEIRLKLGTITAGQGII